MHFLNLPCCERMFQTANSERIRKLPRKPNFAHYLRDARTKRALADAILDRIIHNAYRVELSGESLRKPRASA